MKFNFFEMNKTETKKWSTKIRNNAIRKKSLKTHDDWEKIKAFLKRHPNPKNTDFIDAYVDIGSSFSTGGHKSKHPCFWIILPDGERRTSSYSHCISPEKYMKNKRALFSKVSRKMIQDQTLDYKIDVFKGNNTVECALGGGQVEFIGSHTDHIGAFHRLRDQFIKKYNIDVNAIEYEDAPGGEGGHRWVDKDMERNWKKYHFDNASFQVTSGSKNLEKGGN